MKLREKFTHFMYGRYGIDSFGRFLTGLTFVLLIVNLFLGIPLLYILTLLLLVYMYFRMFSRNYAKRSAENSIFMHLFDRVRSFFRNLFRIGEYKTHHIYHCPKCKQKIRIPRGKGKICITCPRCRTEFYKHS